MEEIILENGKIIYETPWYLRYGFINLWQTTLIGVAILLILEFGLKRNWRRITMETWTYAKTIVLYMEHIAMIAAGFLVAWMFRHRKYNSLKVKAKQQEWVIESQKEDLVALKEGKWAREKEEMKQQRREEEQVRIKEDTPKPLLDIARLFGTEYIKKQFPSGGIIK